MGRFSRIIVSILLSCWVISVSATEIRFAYSVPYKPATFSKNRSQRTLKRP